VIGADEADVRERRARMAQWRGRDEIPAPWLYGTVEQIRERLAEYADAGVRRVMFQHHLFRDLDAVALIGSV
jgi:alkanesulfonate monooxygenase SsuD/methylene tetrahydromethanopterin reductase-like flavin-dependent oxidoreductase (luciferase family)